MIILGLGRKINIGPNAPTQWLKRAFLKGEDICSYVVIRLRLPLYDIVAGDFSAGWMH